MKTKLYILFTLSVLMGMSGCEDFLNQVPVTARSAENFYRTAGDFQNAVMGTYAIFKNPGLYSNGTATASLLWLGEGASDNWDYGQTKNTATLPRYEILEFNVSLSNPILSTAWTGHYIGIGRANAIIEKLPAAEISDALKLRYEGEAKFLRAFFYFNLVRTFGKVQLIENSFSDPFAANTIPRSEVSQVYDLIISDLTTAENNLPTAIPAGEAGRASRWAAKALLGKVYLTRTQYDLASQKLAEVIASGLFNVTANSYAEVFSPTTSFVNNKDVILSVQYLSGLVSQGSGLWSSGIPFGAPGTLFGTTGSGDGFMRPTADLESAYEDGDLRKDASMLPSYVATNGNTINERYMVKYRQPGPQAGDSDVDFPILRYADVLLMHAEAVNELGQTSAAEPFLNQVRLRAGLAPMEGLNQGDFRLAVEQERRVELAFEGHRWFDLVRTNRHVEVMSAKGYPVEDFHKLFPVPQRETDLNPVLENDQNEGY